jgi:type IV pilus assembly protein PilQ
MIRCILALLFVQFTLFSLVSCTSDPSSDDLDGISDSGPAEEGAVASDDPAAQSTASESQIESELNSQDAPAETAQQSEKAAVPSDDKLDNELAQQEPLEGQNTPVESPTPPPAEVAPAPEAQNTPAVEAPAPVPVPDKTRIRDIRYLANSNGGTVVIETTKPIVFQSRLNSATQQFVIEIADVELPAALQRPYVLKDFNSRFGSINAYQGAGSTTARIVLQMNGAITSEPVVQQEGTSLVVVPPTAPPAMAANPPAGANPPSDKSENRPPSALAARTLDEFLSGNQQFFGRPISFQAKDADVRDVVNFLAEESGANVVMSDDVVGKISIKLRKIPWDQALVMVMRTKGLGYLRQGNVLRISTLKALQGETETANKLLEAQKAIVPAVVQVIPISYTALDELVKSVKPFLTQGIGQVVGDNRSGTLIVTDKGDVVDRIVKLVKTLDTAPAQVSIEAKVVEANEQFQDFIGVTWNIGGASKQLSSAGGANGGPINIAPSAMSGALSQQFQAANPFFASLSVGQLDFLGNLQVALTLAEHDQLVKIISSPRISAINREKATIVQQSENVVVQSTAATSISPITKTITRTPVKLQLDVTPQITSDGSVIMDLEILREFLGAVVDQESGAQPVNSRRAKTKVLVRNGQTAVIGGIYSSQETDGTNGLPGLMNIPILGWLFKNRATTSEKNELLIFLTPRIVNADPRGVTQLPENKPAGESVLR